ncbi:MAG: DUF4097 family beta strand repeat-containing protein, partial [Steroidobacter sp.]
VPMDIRVAAVLGVCLLSSTAWSAEKRLDRTFAVTPGGTLTVGASGSDITVTGTDANQVIVQIVATGSQGSLDEMTLSAEQTAGGVAVTEKHRDGGWFGGLWSTRHVDSAITVKVPRRYNIDLKTSGGDLVVTQLQGDALGKTAGGDIRVSQVRGPVRMRTSGGNVTIEDIHGEADVRTSGGDIVVSSVNGSTDVGTSGGSIRLTSIVGATQADTSSGDVIAASIRGNVDLNTSGGDIAAAAIDGKIRTRTSGGNITAELIGANRGISASSSGGNIVLRVSKNITADLNASNSGGSISSDLSVGARQAGKTKLNGAINGGGATIRAHTSGGDIKLQVRD